MHDGRHNIFVLNLISKKTKDVDYDFVGDASENDVAAAHVVLGVKARLFKVKSSVQGMAAKDAYIRLYTGSSSSGTAVLSTYMTHTSTALKLSGSIKDKALLYDEDSEFCLSEESEADSNVVGLGVQLYFKSYEDQ